jgi:ABC-type polar amino acid transport system ATPase subunit
MRHHPHRTSIRPIPSVILLAIRTSALDPLLSGITLYLIASGKAMDPQDIRKKLGPLGRFRALIIGRPNAGKTTILRCIARSANGKVSAFTTKCLALNDISQVIHSG